MISSLIPNNKFIDYSWHKNHVEPIIAASDYAKFMLDFENEYFKLNSVFNTSASKVW